MIDNFLPNREELIKEEFIDEQFLATHSEKENIEYLYITKNLNKDESRVVLGMTEITFCRRLNMYGIHKDSDKIQERKRKTCLKKYGTEVITQSNHFKEKARKTNLERYGVEDYTQCAEYKEKTKATCLRKYGVEHHTKSSECKEKHVKTCLELYGVPNPFESKEVQEKIKQTCLERYGNEKYQKTKEYSEKVCDTKRKHNTFHTSKPEEEVFKMLAQKYNIVERQYRSELYPFPCDFYIPSLDLYIEYQGTWTHGKHPFNPNNAEDVACFNAMKEKAKTSKYYYGAINVWTVRDPLKRETAKDNNLNWLEFFNMKEFTEWLSKQ